MVDDLKVLDLANNLLSGTLPTFYSKLKHLIHLDLSGMCVLNLGHLLGNQFSGHIPDVYGELQSLQHVLLGSNFFTGNLPQYLTHNLTLLDLHGTYDRYHVHDDRQQAEWCCADKLDK